MYSGEGRVRGWSRGGMRGGCGWGGEGGLEEAIKEETKEVGGRGGVTVIQQQGCLKGDSGMTHRRTFAYQEPQSQSNGQGIGGKS